MRFFIFVLFSLGSPNKHHPSVSTIQKPTAVQDTVAVMLVEMKANLAYDATGRTSVGCCQRIIFPRLRILRSAILQRAAL
jgi:hypothetical protein